MLDIPSQLKNDYAYCWHDATFLHIAKKNVFDAPKSTPRNPWFFGDFCCRFRYVFDVHAFLWYADIINTCSFKNATLFRRKENHVEHTLSRTVWPYSSLATYVVIATNHCKTRSLTIPLEKPRVSERFTDTKRSGEPRSAKKCSMFEWNEFCTSRKTVCERGSRLFRGALSFDSLIWVNKEKHGEISNMFDNTWKTGDRQE